MNRCYVDFWGYCVKPPPVMEEPSTRTVFDFTGRPHTIEEMRYGCKQNPATCGQFETHTKHHNRNVSSLLERMASLTTK